MVMTDEKPDLLLPEIDNPVEEESKNLTHIESSTVSIEQGQQCLVDNASIEDREENLMVVTDEKPDLLQPEIDNSVVEESENLTQIESSTVSIEQGQQCLVDNASIEDREENLMVVTGEKPKCVIGTVVIGINNSSVGEKKVSRCRRSTVKRNPLKNDAVMFSLNPFAKIQKQQARLQAEAPKTVKKRKSKR